ncbi:MAG: hypothetical protein ACTSWC_02360 [Promethearchaeota archaeon]
MGNYQIVNIFDLFKQFWQEHSHISISEQVKKYKAVFQKLYPELWQMQVDCYAEDDFDWKEAALKHVFPKYADSVPFMQPLIEKLSNIIPWIFSQAVLTFQFKFDIIFVLYVGLGCGAGWATRYRDQPAVLMGIENIIECGWHSENSLAGLIAHEVGHLVHQEWRNQSQLPNKPVGNDSYWNLYEEGFAMRAEHKILNRESFHEAEGQDNWVEWCHQHRNWLAKEYLNAVEDKEKIRKFFGSWYDIKGYKQTGYFLGHEILKDWESSMSFREIALLPLEEINIKVKQHLNRWAELQ